MRDADWSAGPSIRDAVLEDLGEKLFRDASSQSDDALAPVDGVQVVALLRPELRYLGDKSLYLELYGRDCLLLAYDLRIRCLYLIYRGVATIWTAKLVCEHSEA